MRKKNKPKPVPVAHKEEAHPDDSAADIISQLSDDILVSIISRLPLKEATATSVLSSRWHHLHTRVSRLIFPPFSTELVIDKLAIENNFRKYIKTVNHTLDSYKGGRTLKEFRVHMIRIEEDNVKRCLKFALSREVEILDILRPVYYGGLGDNYNLQIEKLIKSGCQTGLKCLRELSLCYVVTSDVEINLLLSNSPHLESFSLDHSHMPGNVSIVGYSKLQHLSISCPLYLESIEIKNMTNLVSLRCVELRLRSRFVRLDNLPKLIELDTSDEGLFYSSTLCHILSKLPSCICCQLEVLRVSARCNNVHEFRLAKLINVKYLELECESPDWCGDVRRLVRLLVACCSLEKLEMKSEWCQNTVKWTEFGVREVGGDRFYWMGKASPKLKKVKLSGYLGSQTELEFATYIIQNVGALEELIIEPCRVSNHIRHKATANFWKQLRPIIPQSLNLKFI